MSHGRGGRGSYRSESWGRVDAGLAAVAVVAFLASVFVATVGGCGESHDKKKSDPPEEQKSAAEQWIEQRDTVVMPWTRVLDDETVEQAVVGEDRLEFPDEAVGETLRNLDENDIVVSGHTDLPFLRRVEGVERRDDSTLVVETSDATLTEAIYKGSFGTGAHRNGPPGSEETDRSPLRQRRQPAGPQREAVDTEDASEVGPAPGNAGTDFVGDLTGSPSTGNSLSGYEIAGGEASAETSATLAFHSQVDLSVEPEFHFRLDIAPLDGHDYRDEGYDRYWTDVPCDQDDECFDSETCDEWTAGQKFCAKNPASVQTCGEIIGLLRNVQKNYPGCYDRWERYWEGKLDERPVCKKVDRGFWWLPIDNPGKHAPVRAKYVWAQNYCSSDVKLFETDMKADVDFSITETELYAKGGAKGTYSYPLVELETTPNMVFWAGPVPIVVTFTPGLTVELGACIEGTAGIRPKESIELDSMRDDDYTMRVGGVHYYGSEAGRRAGTTQLWKDSGYEASGTGCEQMRGGDCPATGTLHTNYSGDDELDRNALGFGTVETFGRGEFKTTMKMISSFQVLLYDMVGFNLKPLVGYAHFAGSVGSGRDVEVGEDVCDVSMSRSCNLGYQVGAKGALEFAAQFPICDNCMNDKIDTLASKAQENPSSRSLGEIPDYGENESTSAELAELYNTCGTVGDDGGGPGLLGLGGCQQEGYCSPQCSWCLKECVAGSCAGEDDDRPEWIVLRAGETYEEIEANPEGAHDPRGVELDQLRVATPEGDELAPTEMRVDGETRQTGPIEEADFACDSARWQVDYTCACSDPGSAGCDDADRCRDATCYESEESEFGESYCSRKTQRCFDTNCDCSTTNECGFVSYRRGGAPSEADIVSFEDSLAVKFDEPIPDGARVDVVRLNERSPGGDNVSEGVEVTGGPGRCDACSDGSGLNEPLGVISQCEESGGFRARLADGGGANSMQGYPETQRIERDSKLRVEGNRLDVDFSCAPNDATCGL